MSCIASFVIVYVDNSFAIENMDHVKRIRYLSPMRAVKVQARLRIRAVSPESSLLAHTSIESRGTFRQKARSLAPLNGCACAIKICHDGMLEDTNSLDGAHIRPLREEVGICLLPLKLTFECGCKETMWRKHKASENTLLPKHS